MMEAQVVMWSIDDFKNVVLIGMGGDVVYRQF
jgi:hypothetical protein